MDSQQLAPRITSLESRVSTLEDEGKIIKGEVKQILLEIRAAVLSRDNPFDEGAKSHPAPPQLRVVPDPEPATPAPIEPVHAAPATEPTVFGSSPITTAAPVQPLLLHGPPAEPEGPRWSLLTVASISAWAEEAMRRLGALRFEILMDLCETAGHITPEARAALSRVTQLDVTPLEHAPSTNETVAVLRQLDALLQDEAGSIALPRALGL